MGKISLRVLLDPIGKVRDFGINSRIVGPGAADAPGNDSAQFVAADQWTTRIALKIIKDHETSICKFLSCHVNLARILSTLSSTDHAVSNIILTIGTSTIWEKESEFTKF